MKKLYCINYNIKFKANKHSIFNKIRHYDVEKTHVERYLIIEENEIEDFLKKETTDQINEWNKEIEENGKIALWDNGYGYREIDIDVSEYEISNLYVREANISECIEQLTPEQYQEIYGNILNLKGE